MLHGSKQQPVEATPTYSGAARTSAASAHQRWKRASNAFKAITPSALKFEGPSQFTGYLTKDSTGKMGVHLGNMFPTTNRRWFCLRRGETVLSYYKDHHTQVLQGQIDCWLATVEIDRKEERSLIVHSTVRELRLHAETQRDFDMWLCALLCTAGGSGALPDDSEERKLLLHTIGEATSLSYYYRFLRQTHAGMEVLLLFWLQACLVKRMASVSDWPAAAVATATRALDSYYMEAQQAMAQHVPTTSAKAEAPQGAAAKQHTPDLISLMGSLLGRRESVDKAAVDALFTAAQHLLATDLLERFHASALHEELEAAKTAIRATALDQKKQKPLRSALLQEAFEKLLDSLGLQQEKRSALREMPDVKKSQLLLAFFESEHAALADIDALAPRLSVKKTAPRSAGAAVSIEAAAADDHSQDVPACDEGAEAIVGVCGFLLPGGANALSDFGLSVDLRHTVTAISEDSDAEAVGVLEIGDRLLSVDGEQLIEPREGGLRFNRSLEPMLKREEAHFVQAREGARLRTSEVQLRGAPLALRYWRRDMWALAENATERRGGLDLSKSGVRFGYGHGASELSLEEKDELLEGCCAYLCRNGFGDGHLPERLGKWLQTSEGEMFLENCVSILSRVDSHASASKDGEMLAWMVRAVQLQLREVAPKVMGKSVGGDELIPLMEHVIAHARLKHGWTTIRLMEAVLDDETLLEMPDLDGALQGFAVPCHSIVTQVRIVLCSACPPALAVLPSTGLRDVISAIPRQLRYHTLLLHRTAERDLSDSRGFGTRTSLFDQPWAVLWLTLAYAEEEAAWASMSAHDAPVNYQGQLQERISKMIAEQADSVLQSASRLKAHQESGGQSAQLSAELSSLPYGPLKSSATFRKMSTAKVDHVGLS